MLSSLDEFTTGANDTGQDKQESGGTLRQKLEDAFALIKQLTSENEALKSKEAERAVSATWDELEVPQAIRKLYQGDQAADAIKKWWEDSKSLFNIQGAEQEQTETDEARERREQFGQFQQASALGSDSHTTGHEAALAKAAEIKAKGKQATQADRDSFYASLGIPKF